MLTVAQQLIELLSIEFAQEPPLEGTLQYDATKVAAVVIECHFDDA